MKKLIITIRYCVGTTIDALILCQAIWVINWTTIDLCICIIDAHLYWAGLFESFIEQLSTYEYE